MGRPEFEARIGRPSTKLSAIARALKKTAKKMGEEEKSTDAAKSGSATTTTARRGRGRGQNAGTSLLPTKAGEPVVSDYFFVDDDDPQRFSCRQVSTLAITPTSIRPMPSFRLYR
jgi:hypothetical protein